MRSIKGVSEMIAKEGVVNLDFQDLRSVMENGGGVAMIGLGEARGEGMAMLLLRRLCNLRYWILMFQMQEVLW